MLREGVVLGQGEVWQLLERAEAQVIGQGRVFLGRKNYDGVSVSVGQLKWTGGVDGLNDGFMICWKFMPERNKSNLQQPHPTSTHKIGDL